MYTLPNALSTLPPINSWFVIHAHTHTHTCSKAKGTRSHSFTSTESATRYFSLEGHFDVNIF